MTRPTEAEWSVLQILWQKESYPLGELVSALYPLHGWSRNTVHTYLTRMERKGLAAIRRDTDPHRYAAAVTREACARQARSAFLHNVYGGAAGDLVAAFLKESPISQEERDRLRKLLDGMEV